MVKVASVRFKKAGKVYYFDPLDFDLKAGDHVIVETARGQEFGTITEDLCEVEDSELVSPLKEILRIATEKDIHHHEENLKKKQRAMEICQEKIEKNHLEMKLTDVEYTFDNSKVIFYFTADGRIDFRELIKDLAAVFRVRIELRQIGVRDEAKMLGGIGTCGRPLCCHSWMPDFNPVSIKMAKVQNLSLNPTKISGICGRLMCCLKFENDVYNELRKGMPEVGERVRTPDGIGVVTESNLLRGTIQVRLLLEEKGEDQQEKLSPDAYTFTKQQIHRLSGRKKDKPQTEEMDPELMKEIQDLLGD